MYHEECSKDETFIGNVGIERDFSEYKTIKYRLGSVAYDIHGNILNTSLLKPMFVKNSSLAEYDRIMMAQLSKIRKGY